MDTTLDLIAPDHNPPGLLDLIGGLIEYAERFADENDEPDGGDCRSTIAQARALLESLA